MAILGKQDILGKDDRQYDEFPVPEWGGDVRIRSMSGEEVFRFQKEVKSAGGVDERKALGLLAARSVVDADGGRVFEDEDVPALLAKNAAAINLVAMRAMRLNKLREEDLRGLVGN